jgi:putative ABC transport system permease protein
MKFLPLVWSNLKRKKIRTLFTLGAVVVAFILFAYLGAVGNAFTAGIDATVADRLLVIHKVTLILPLPISYYDRIAAVPGVEQVSYANWFGGIYQDPKNFFGQMAVDDNFLEMYPEYVLPEEQKKAWMADRAGAIVGRVTAKRFGFKVGDKLPIQGTFYRKLNGPNSWEFNISGIYDGAEKETDTTGMYFHYDYLNQAVANGNLGLVGWYALRVEDPSRNEEIASKIDALFANSPAETKTEPEKALAQGFANQVGNVGQIVSAVLTAVFFTLLVVAGNTMAQSVRERTSELAILKTVGFSHRQVLALVLAESTILALVGGGIGLLLGWLAVTFGGDPSRGYLPVFFVPPRFVVLGLAFMILVGLATGLLPAARAMRLRIVDALRRV